jgi:acetoin utilization protein AcuB
MRKSTPIRDCMSRLPAEAERNDPLGSVLQQMRDQHCHHVPVMDGTQLLGVLSRGDLHEAVLKHGKAAAKLPAGDICTQDALTVSPMTPVVEVARLMAERHIGSALVTDGDVLVGIFTASDAVKLVSQF